MHRSRVVGIPSLSKYGRCCVLQQGSGTSPKRPSCSPRSPPPHPIHTTHVMSTGKRNATMCEGMPVWQGTLKVGHHDISMLRFQSASSWETWLRFRRERAGRDREKLRPQPPTNYSPFPNGFPRSGRVQTLEARGQGSSFNGVRSRASDTNRIPSSMPFPPIR